MRLSGYYNDLNRGKNQISKYLMMKPQTSATYCRVIIAQESFFCFNDYKLADFRL